nr:heme lyase CcmF/NrfE family subunit [Bacilli bacterium]
MIIGDVGRIALWLAMLVIPYIWIVSIYGVWKKNNRLIKSAKRAIILQFGLIIIASAALLTLLLSLNFRFAYVAEYTSKSLSVLYRIAAFWGGDAGSLLFWLLVMSIYLFVVMLVRHEDEDAYKPIVTAIIAFVMTFFILIVNVMANPFATLSYTPENGNGLNELLQNPGMTVHPVNLYLGYIGFLVPFAYAMASLWLKKTDASWLAITRRWTLIAWLFLSCGIIYGAHWSYEELGWGGYWSWDPIENAALMPWLSATAFLHSAMIQERKAMFKTWNVILIALTFMLTMFGTALTRGGMIWSIHAFSNGSMGFFFMLFVGILALGSVVMIVWRFSSIRASAKLEAIVSKETGFLLNNILFLGMLFAVFLGTIFPLVTEAITGSQMLVNGSFYDTVVLPIGVLVILLMAIGPLLAWRKASINHVRRALLWPFILSLLATLFLALSGYRNLLALASYFAAFLVMLTIFLEFTQGVMARRQKTKEAIVLAFLRMIRKNQRRYGGYIVHLALVIMVIGLTSTGSFGQKITVNLKPGQSMSIGDYVLLYHGLETDFSHGKIDLKADVVVYTGQGQTLGLLKPAVTFYENGQQPATDLALYSTLLSDLYVVLDGTDNSTQEALFDVHLNPLVSMIWLGGYLFVFGAILCFWPERKKKEIVEHNDAKQALLQAINDIEDDFAMGKIDQPSYQMLSQQYQKQMAQWDDYDREERVKIEQMLQDEIVRRLEVNRV